MDRLTTVQRLIIALFFPPFAMFIGLLEMLYDGLRHCIRFFQKR